MQEEFIALNELSIFLKKKDIPWRLIGRGSNSYILYLIGISSINPIEFKLGYENYFGMDTEDDKASPSQHLITIGVPQSSYLVVVEFLKAFHLLSSELAKYDEHEFSIGKIKIIKSEPLIKVKNYNAEVDISLLEKFVIEDYEDHELISALTKIFGNDCQNKIGLSEVIKVHGLLNSEWNYEDVISAFMDLDLPISEVPVHSDDLFKLFNKSMINKDAWRYVEYINQGKHFPKDVDFGLEPKILKWCNNASFLYPRVNTIEYFVKEYKLNRGML